MITEVPEGYWYCRPNVIMRHAPQGDFWWIEIVDSNNNQLFIDNLVEGIDNNDYQHNGFMYKRLASFSCENELDAISKFRTLCSLFRQFKENEVETLTEKDGKPWEKTEDE